MRGLLWFFFLTLANGGRLQPATPIVRSAILGSGSLSSQSLKRTSAVYSSSTDDIAESEISSYLESNGIVPPKRLGALLRILQLQEMTLVAPLSQGSFRGHHPLVVPLARREDDVTIGLLRWPTAKRWDEMPVVSGRVKEPASLSLLGSSVADYVMRMAAAADYSGAEDSARIVDIANEGLPDEKQYEPGSVKNLNKGLERYLLLHVAAFPETYQALARDHLESREDVQSALITAEKGCDVFGDWAYMHAFHARLLNSVPGYNEEARDAARKALSKNLWTLACSRDEFRELVLLAGKDSVEEFVTSFRRMAEEEHTSPNMLLGQTPPEEAALDRASRLMDLAVCDAFANGGGHDWDSLRPKLVDLYSASGSTSLARLVKGKSLDVDV